MTTKTIIDENAYVNGPELGKFVFAITCNIIKI